MLALIPRPPLGVPARHTVIGVETNVGDRGVIVAVVTDPDTALVPGSSSVGTAVALEHIAASAVGEQVTVVAVVRSVAGRRVGFDVEATDAGGTVVGRGSVERVVVDDDRFLARLALDRS